MIQHDIYYVIISGSTGEKEVEKQKQLEKESMEVDPDSKLSKLLVRLDTLEGVVKEIINDKGKVSSSNLHNKGCCQEKWNISSKGFWFEKQRK
jgi:hypothetical protein